MSYEFMRLIVMFDLPVKTKKEKHRYTEFRKFLISKGYLMLQYSVYVKIFANRDASIDHIKLIKRNVPKEGQIRIMMLTEKQFSRMEVILGGISRQEKTITEESFIIL
jgi:CRISPR-associated protein Cas2